MYDTPHSLSVENHSIFFLYAFEDVSTIQGRLLVFTLPILLPPILLSPILLSSIILEILLPG